MTDEQKPAPEADTLDVDPATGEPVNKTTDQPTMTDDNVGVEVPDAPEGEAPPVSDKADVTASGEAVGGSAQPGDGTEKGPLSDPDPLAEHVTAAAPGTIKPLSADDPDIAAHDPGGGSQPQPAVVNTSLPPRNQDTDVSMAASTDDVVDQMPVADEYADVHPSKRPVGHRPTPAGPSSHPRTRSHRYGN